MTAPTQKPAAGPDQDLDLIIVEGLVKHFPIRAGILRRQVGAVQAVDGLNFAVKRRETFSIVGESGCGKSTTARLLTRLLAIKGTPPSLINVPRGCPFHPRCAFAARNGGLSEEVRPELVPVEPGHTVACHLSKTDRDKVWEHEIAPQL